MTNLSSPTALLEWLKKNAIDAIALSHDAESLNVATSAAQAATLKLSAQANDLFATAETNQLETILQSIATLKLPVVAYNAKPLLHLCPALQILDVELMLYALQGSGHKLEQRDAPSLYALYEHSRQQFFAKQLNRVYWRIDQPVQRVLATMEMRGIKIDAGFLLGLSQRFGSRMAELETQIHTEAKGEFNIGSPKQLGEILFERLGFAGGKKSAKSGAYSTDSDVLEDLAAQGHAIATHVLEWRGLSKLKSTYTDALPKAINPRTGRVHTTFNLASTSTGRLSSTDPNLQNIPIRTTEGKEIRKAFIAEEGNVLISADYSQIELRLLAHMADIPQLKTAFHNGIDIHTKTAAQVFGLKTEEVTSEQRRSAKAINFGIIYGQSAFGLAAGLGISREQAGQYIKAYFEQFPGIQKYMEETKAFARTHGYVETLLGRKCYTPLINDKNGGLRQFAERAAINAPLQGSAADIIKKAMVQLHDLGIDLLLQVHDELIIECTEAKAEAVAALTEGREPKFEGR
jgi:DNA polymerase-1